MCIVEIKTTDNRKLTCFVSCSRQVASSGEANCSGVIRTRRSTVISPNSTCRKSTCKRKKKESCSPQRIACGEGRGGGSGMTHLWQHVPGFKSQRQSHFWIEFVVGSLLWGLFLESPGDFPGPKSNTQIKILRIKTWFLADKPFHFVLLYESLSC